MDEELVGRVVKFFSKPSVAAVEITSGILRVGDSIRIKGHTTDLRRRSIPCRSRRSRSRRPILASLWVSK